jgi:hypothetical protein
MRKSFHNKYSIIAVITLFLILAITPAIQAASINKFTDIEEEFFKIEIEEIKADGSIDKKDVELSKTKTNELKKELLSTKSVDSQLSILKKYNLIPQDKTVKDLENEMNEKASSFGITPKDDPQQEKFRLPILLQFFKKVSATYFGGVSINLGLKFLINIINLIPLIKLPTFDFVDVFGGSYGVVITEGLFLNNSHVLITFPGISGMIGFVGYRIKFPFMLHVYTGLSVLTFGLGLGIHLSD